MVRKGESSTGALLRTLSDALRWRSLRALSVRGAGRTQDVARRPTISILSHPPASPHAPALSIRPRVLSSRAYGHLRQKLRLNDMTPQLKIPTDGPRDASPCRSLMNPATESHSVEIATAPQRCPRPHRWKK
ncbi:unnamed protein product [Colias eurytheme]|nr:unnamed protein product [Colias eurytheme]